VIPNHDRTAQVNDFSSIFLGLGITAIYYGQFLSMLLGALDYREIMLDLTGKNALVTGIANNRSIAWGIAQQLHTAGANIGVTYLPDDRGRMENKVRELTEPLQPSLFLPCNVQDDVQVDETFKLANGSNLPGASWIF
jgi:hypothetical protein